jgi:ABC-type transport system involved in cytochrome bd biosynthesis fused ATPase/permease subunit
MYNMSIQKFLIQLLAATILATALCWLPGYVIQGWFVHMMFMWVIIGLFVAIALVLFTLGTVTAKSPDKYLFHGVTMGSVFLKLVVGLGTLFVYDRNFVPINNFFIWIFLITYVVFTVWEVTYMTKLAKVK